MRPKLLLTRVVAVLFLIGCADAAAPNLFGPFQPEFAIVPSVQANGQFTTNGRAILKGFNPTNPHHGDAIVATFFFPTTTGNIITRVTDHLANGTPVGNTYQLVDFVTAGGIGMATYVAVNVQNFPDPNVDASGNPDQNTVLAIQADLSDSITRGGMTITAYSGVQPLFAQALGAVSHGSGSSDAQTVADAGTVSVAANALVYGVTLVNQLVGFDPPAGFGSVSVQSDGATLKASVDSLYQRSGAGSQHPTWVWGFNSSAAGTHPGTWLASVFSLNEAPTSSTGNLTVSASTTGSNLDADGYTVTVDGGANQAIGTNGSVTFTGLAAGSHSVALSGMAGNCTVSGTNPQTVTVPSGGTAATTFDVSCSATTGNLTVSASTTGSNLDADGYSVTVDGGSPQAIGINASVTFNGLSAGSHNVVLSGVAGNCTVSGGNTQTVNVPTGGTASTTFTVSCAATTGNLTVSTSTTGSSLDPDGYTVTVDGGSPQAVGINASVSYTNLSAGNHTVAISGVAGNCTVSGGTSRTVSVPSGGTATTTFSVSCTTPPGNLQVNTSTTGTGLDPDGYTATVDGATSKAVAINGSVTFTGLSAGSHNVVLSGVAASCTVSGGATRTATVPSGGTVTVSYAVSCTQPNSAPVVNAGSDEIVLLSLLGVTYTLNASFSDPDNDGPWSYTINWGDGSTSTGTAASQGTISASHHYANIISTRTVTVTVRDAHGAAGSDSKVLTLIL
jgi:PKD domain